MTTSNATILQKPQTRAIPQQSVGKDRSPPRHRQYSNVVSGASLSMSR